MAILFEKKHNDISLIVYQIDETDEFYLRGIDFTDFDYKEYNSISNLTKKRQWLASRYWIKKISGETQTLHLAKTSLGKPHITNIKLNFSISHSKDKIAVICSSAKQVAIDIESIQDKIIRLKHKFLHPLDFYQGDDIKTLTLIWSAKETLYKYYHDKSLYSFKEQIVLKGLTLNAIDYELFDGRCGLVHYHKLKDLKLTWLIQG